MLTSESLSVLVLIAPSTDGNRPIFVLVCGICWDVLHDSVETCHVHFVGECDVVACGRHQPRITLATAAGPARPGFGILKAACDFCQARPPMQWTFWPVDRQIAYLQTICLSRMPMIQINKQSAYPDCQSRSAGNLFIQLAILTQIKRQSACQESIPD